MLCRFQGHTLKVIDSSIVGNWSKILLQYVYMKRTDLKNYEGSGFSPQTSEQYSSSAYISVEDEHVVTVG